MNKISDLGPLIYKKSQGTPTHATCNSRVDLAKLIIESARPNEILARNFLVGDEE